ncbi:DUF1858 domain-containing protein [bacterium]|mgnify:CR=1 FL=1|nr:MAG: DUF1858 domain-containing protein [bacterium]
MINYDTPVDVLLDEYPESNKWLMKRRIHCTECGEPVWGTIGELIKSKGMDTEELLAELNEYLKTCGYR